MAAEKPSTEGVETNQTAGTVALELGSSSTDLTTGNTGEEIAKDARTEALESVDFYVAQGYVDIATDTLDLLERQFGSHPEIDERRRQLEARAWDRLEIAFNDGTPVYARVAERLNEGLRVDVDGITAFLPGSEVDLLPVRNLDFLRRQTIRAKVIKVDRKSSQVVVSRKAFLEDRKEQALSQIEEGVIIEGEITKLTDYGAYVDLGGIEGLLHVAEMSWDRLQNPAEMFRVGDSVHVKVLRCDRERKLVFLGFKQLLPDSSETLSTLPDELMRLTINRRTFYELGSKTAEILREAALAQERIAKDWEEIELFKTETREILKSLRTL